MKLEVEYGEIVEHIYTVEIEVPDDATPEQVEAAVEKKRSEETVPSYDHCHNNGTGWFMSYTDPKTGELVEEGYSY